MDIDFKKIDYLEFGNNKQRKVHSILINRGLLQVLEDFDPIVVGTIPIGIDIDESDVDILLKASDRKKLIDVCTANFSLYDDYRFYKVDGSSVIFNFKIDRMEFELFASPLDTDQQNGYLHMLKEYQILKREGDLFKSKIIQLKQSGMKTEPAFCQLLGIEGDPYVKLLKYP